MVVVLIIRFDLFLCNLSIFVVHELRNKLEWPGRSTGQAYQFLFTAAKPLKKRSNSSKISVSLGGVKPLAVHHSKVTDDSRLSPNEYFIAHIIPRCGKIWCLSGAREIGWKSSPASSPTEVRLTLVPSLAQICLSLWPFLGLPHSQHLSREAISPSSLLVIAFAIFSKFIAILCKYFNTVHTPQRHP